MVDIYNIFNANLSSSHQSDITPTKMSNMPFKDAIPLVQPIAGEYNQFLFNTAYSSLSPLKGAAIVQSMQ